MKIGILSKRTTMFAGKLKKYLELQKVALELRVKKKQKTKINLLFLKHQRIELTLFF